MNKVSSVIMNGLDAVESVVAEPDRGEEVVFEPVVLVVGDGVATGEEGL
jgi:hypothetical protein